MKSCLQQVVVNAPGKFANSLLNGSKGILLGVLNDGFNVTAYVLLTSGKESGRTWQFSPDHLTHVCDVEAAG